MFSQGQEPRATGAARALRLRLELDSSRAAIESEIRSWYSAYTARESALAPAGHTITADVAVKKTESITNQSVSDIVTSTPGTYSVDFALVATVADSKKTAPIREHVRVVVK